MAKMTPQELQNQDAEFSAGFAEDQQQRPEQTEDEAFGLADEPESAKEESAEQTTGEEEGPGVDDAAGAAAGGAQGDAPAVAVEIDANAADGTDVGAEGQADEPGEQVDPKDEQRAKSWEGRLRKREAELAAREKALAERSQAEESGETGVQEEAEASEAVSQAAEQVQSGKMTPEQAIKTLSEDFGPEFANLLDVLIEHRATGVADKLVGEKVGGVSKTIDTLISEIVSDRERDHFESIEDAHPDFMELAESDDFKGWIDGLPDDKRAKALQAIDGGNARQVVKVLAAYKEHAASLPAEDGQGEDMDPVAAANADAAEGVRSSGALKLPDAPQKASGYEEAWDQF
jgi:hypothetical protein